MKYGLSKLKNNDFSLVLSGGGALGFYYLGVFKFLEERDIYPKEIIGTSIGAVLGSLWAQGYLSEELISKSKSILLSCNNLSLNFSKEFKKILLEEYFKEIKPFKIPFKAITLEYNSLDPKIFSFPNNDFSIKDVILAATALPGRYDPVIVNGEKYLDAYLQSNFPIEFASYDIILGVDVLSNCTLSKFRESRSLIIKSKKNNFNIYSRSLFKLVQKDSKRKALDFNCIYLAPEFNTCDLFEYSKINEMINIGYEEIKKAFNH